MNRQRLRFLVLLSAIALHPGLAAAHDASGSGGLFRTRDAGATWLPVNAGSFVSGALALAVSPVDPHHLLLATDVGVSRSRNGGRDWLVEAPDILTGPVFGAVFDADGRRVLVAGPAAIFRNDGDRWQRLSVPSDSMPARALIAGRVRGRVYLAGRRGLFRSDDWGRSWIGIGSGLRTDHASGVTTVRDRPDEVYVVAGGRTWASLDAGRRWEPRSDGLPPRGVEALGADPQEPARLWSVAADQLFRSDDGGRGWRPVGRPLPVRPIVAQALAVVPGAVMIATDQGVYRSPDEGANWALSSEGLPAHLEAGVLARDPMDPTTIYAGFAVRSRELLALIVLKQAAESSRATLIWLLGGLGVAVVVAAGVAGRRHLARPSHAPPPPVSR